MTGNYMILGLCFALLAGTFLLVLIGYLVYLGKESRCPLYQRRMGKLKLPEAFSEQLRGAYEKSGTIEGTLSILEERYPSGKLNLRLRAAQDYLYHSRYKDWESALGFLLDGSEEMEQVQRNLILLELQKRKRLPDYKNTQKNYSNIKKTANTRTQKGLFLYRISVQRERRLYMRKKKKGTGLFIVLVIAAALASGGIVFYALPLVVNTGKYTHLIFFLLWIALSALIFLGPKALKKRRGGR